MAAGGRHEKAPARNRGAVHVLAGTADSSFRDREPIEDAAVCRSSATAGCYGPAVLPDDIVRTDASQFLRRGVSGFSLMFLAMQLLVDFQRVCWEFAMSRWELVQIAFFGLATSTALTALVGGAIYVAVAH